MEEAHKFHISSETEKMGLILQLLCQLESTDSAKVPALILEVVD